MLGSCSSTTVASILEIRAEAMLVFLMKGLKSTNYGTGSNRMTSIPSFMKTGHLITELLEVYEGTHQVCIQITCFQAILKIIRPMTNLKKKQR
jgi:hypothetical protein